MLSNDNFRSKGIQVPQEYLPKPLPYGIVQSCTVGVPWPNEPFYFAIVAEDGTGNKGMVSNIVSVFNHEEAKQIDADSLLLMEMMNYGNS
jgi:hypothetical protein